jgi:hypothetical protein
LSSVVRVKFERQFVTAFLAIICATLARFIHEHWFILGLGVRLYESPANHYAPETYRIAIPALGRLILHVFRITDAPAVSAVMDFCFAFSAMYLLYLLLDSQSADVPNRSAAVGLLLAFLWFPVMWMVPWIRIETLPTCFYVACALILLAHSARSVWWTLGLLALTAWQAFVRSDVPVVLGVAVFLVGLTQTAKREFGSRRFLAIRGLAIAIVAGMIQVYLQFVRYSYARNDPNGSAITLKYNLALHDLMSLALTLLPFLLFMAMFLVKKPHLGTTDLIVLFASALYLPLWLTVGRVGEVRLYAPFQMALSVVAARVCSIVLTAERSSNVENDLHLVHF